MPSQMKLLIALLGSLGVAQAYAQTPAPVPAPVLAPIPLLRTPAVTTPLPGPVPAPAPTAAAPNRIMFTTGDVQIRDTAGQMRPAAKGAEIRQGDTIVTAPGGYAQAQMQGGFLAARPGTQVRMDALAQAGSGAAAASQMALLQGAVRVISAESGGAVQPAGAAQPPSPPPQIMIQTPNASISLRNADGEAAITPPRAPGAAPVTVSVVNRGAATVQGATGAVQPVAINQAATITGNALPKVISAASLPAPAQAVLPGVVPAAPKAGQLPSPVAPVAGAGAPAIPVVQLPPAVAQLALQPAPQLPKLSSPLTTVAPPAPKIISAAPSPVAQLLPPALKLPPALAAVTQIRPAGQQAALPVPAGAAPQTEARTMVSQRAVVESANTITQVVKVNTALTAEAARANALTTEAVTAAQAAGLNAQAANLQNAGTQVNNANIVVQAVKPAEAVLNQPAQVVVVNNNLGSLGTNADSAKNAAVNIVAAAPPGSAAQTKAAAAATAQTGVQQLAVKQQTLLQKAPVVPLRGITLRP